jgi:hypothetical protein
MKPAGAAVHQRHVGGEACLFERADGVDAHALVAQQDVTDAENDQGALTFWNARPVTAGR